MNWGNAVTACTRCNCLKGSLPLKEAEKKVRMGARRKVVVAHIDDIEWG